MCMHSYMYIMCICVCEIAHVHMSVFTCTHARRHALPSTDPQGNPENELLLFSLPYS